MLVITCWMCRQAHAYLAPCQMPVTCSTSTTSTGANAMLFATGVNPPPPAEPEGALARIR